MNKYVWKFALTAAAVVALAACSDKKAEEAAAPAAPEGAPAVAAVEYDAEKVLNVYNWPDYIPENLIADFEKESGLKANYSTFETNEVLHAKLVAGNSGYDIVVPGSTFAKPQIDAGLLLPLDKSKLSNIGNLDQAIMSKVESADPGQKHLVPWAWNYTTVGINKGKVEKALAGMPMPENAWDLVFKPEYTSKLKKCGIAFLDSPQDVFMPALHYIGKSSASNDVADYKLAGEMQAKIRPDVRSFTATMIDDVASGKVCAVIGWGGDINIAKARAIENGNGEVIEALSPSTGAVIFLDMLAIPKDAKHVNNAHAFINYFMRPEVAASLTNELNYATGNKASLANIKPEIAQNPTIMLDEANMTKLQGPGVFSNEAKTAMGAAYTAFKKGGK